MLLQRTVYGAWSIVKMFWYNLKWPLLLLVVALVVTIFGAIFCGCGASGSASGDDTPFVAVFTDTCQARSLYKAATVGWYLYLDEYEIVSGPCLHEEQCEPGYGHADCRAYFQGQWFWCKILPGWGVELTLSPRIPIDVDSPDTRTYTLSGFAEAVERWQAAGT